MKITKLMKEYGIYITNDGKIHKEISNDFTGVYKRWYKNGQLNGEFFYKNRKLHGKSRKWHDDGELYYEHFFREGKRIT